MRQPRVPAPPRLGDLSQGKVSGSFDEQAEEAVLEMLQTSHRRRQDVISRRQ